MRLFYKIFFTAMFISIISVAATGYFMIGSGFRAQLRVELDACRDYNDIVFLSLSDELCDIDPGTLSGSGNYDEVKNAVSRLLRSISVSGADRKISVCVIDAERGTVFSSLDAEHLSYISDNFRRRIGKIPEDAVITYIEDETAHTVRRACYMGSTFYIETARDCARVFEVEREQRKVLAFVMLVAFFLSGMAAFAVSKLLTRRVDALTEATRAMSGGDMKKRAEIDGGDEIAELSRDFNLMACRLEEKMAELQDEAERNELFVGAFAHEIKTPLTSVIGYADLMRGRELSSDEYRLSAEYIFSEGRRLEVLSMRLLELIVLRRRSLRPTRVDVRALLESTRALFMPSLSGKKISFCCTADSAHVYMEEELLKTVFLNLFDNARKAIDGEGEIRVLGQRREKFYEVFVCDTGRGMEADELSKITEAFYMIDKSRSRMQGGAGLGLAICSEILKLHGFDIAFESAVGEGTKVTVRMKYGEEAGM